jgi:hemolysin activation/secretion protein
MDKRKQRIAMTIISILFFVSIITVSTAAFAQQVPSIGGAVKEAAPPPKETPAKKEPPAAPVIVQEEVKPFSLPEGEKIFIKDFNVEGAGKADENEITAILAPYKERELTMAEITEASNKLTTFYRDKGYLVAEAYVPKQDATDGILLIRVTMGNYGNFSLKNTSPIRTSFLQGVFDRVKKTSPVVTQDGLERAMLLVREMSGAKLPEVAIGPGVQPGTSDFAVEVDRSQRFNGYLMGDNQGSKYTGRNRVYGGIDINSPLGIADKFSVSAMTTEDSGLQNLRFSYGFPLSYNGLRTEFAASHTTYELGDVYSDLEAKGTADVLEGTISYPLKRTNNQSIDLSLNIAYKELHDDLNAVDSSNPRDEAVATLGIQRAAYGSLFGCNLFTTMSAGVSVGTLTIKDDDQKALNDAGANTSGTFSKLNLSFLSSLDLTEKFSLRAQAKAQKVLTSHNLDSVEQMFISGQAGVKAYTESVSFDNGYVANLELRYALPTFFGVKHTLGAFFDNGWVYAQDGDYVENDKIMLTNVGLGYYISFKQLFGAVQLAYPIGKDRVVEDPGTRVLMQVGMTF